MGEQTIRVVVVEDEKRLARNIAAHISGIPSFEAAAVFYNGEDDSDGRYVWSCRYPVIADENDYHL